MCKGRGVLPQRGVTEGVREAVLIMGFQWNHLPPPRNPATPACPVMTCLGSLFQRHTQAPPRETLTPWVGAGGPLGTLLGDHANRLGGELDGTGWLPQLGELAVRASRVPGLDQGEAAVATPRSTRLLTAGLEWALKPRSWRREGVGTAPPGQEERPKRVPGSG